MEATTLPDQQSPAPRQVTPNIHTSHTHTSELRRTTPLKHALIASQTRQTGCKAAGTGPLVLVLVRWCEPAGARVSRLRAHGCVNTRYAPLNMPTDNIRRRRGLTRRQTPAYHPVNRRYGRQLLYGCYFLNQLKSLGRV